MSHPKIRHIATSYDGAVIATGEFKRHVYTWNIEAKKLLADFDSVLEFGGSRLAVSGDGQLCAAGAYFGITEKGYAGGSVAVHETLSGKMLWQNRSIKRVQGLNFSMHWPHTLLAVFSDQPLHVINVESGLTMRKIRGIRSLYESPHGPIQFRESSSGYSLCNSETEKEIGRLKRHSFSTLDVTFSDDAVLVSEAGGPTTCYDLRDCSQAWVLDLEKGHHLLKITYNEKTQEFLGIDWNYEKGGDREILWLDEATGAVKRRLVVTGTPWEAEFAMRGTLLITCDGVMIDTCNGREIASLGFPRETDQITQHVDQGAARKIESKDSKPERVERESRRKSKTVVNPPQPILPRDERSKLRKKIMKELRGEDDDQDWLYGTGFDEE